MLFLNVRNVQYNIEFCVLTYQYEHLWYRVLPSDTHARPNVSVHSDVWAVSQRHAAGGIVRPTLRVLTRGRRSSFFLYHFYFPAQLVGGFTLSVDKPWSRVSSLLSCTLNTVGVVVAPATSYRVALLDMSWDDMYRCCFCVLKLIRNPKNPVQ